MKKTIYVALLAIGILFINGCDTPDYSRTTYKQLHIAKLNNILGTGYEIEGSGKMLGVASYILLHFCKNNRYIYEGSRVYRGKYRVDLAKDEIIMTGDDTDSSGRHLHGVIKTNSGYFEQKEKYIFEGLDVKIYDLQYIKDADCVVKN